MLFPKYVITGIFVLAFVLLFKSKLRNSLDVGTSVLIILCWPAALVFAYRMKEGRVIMTALLAIFALLANWLVELV